MDLLPVLSRSLAFLMDNGHVLFHPQGGLCLVGVDGVVDLSRRPDMEDIVPFRCALDGACGEHHFLGLHHQGTYTGLIGRRLTDGTVVYQPAPVSGTLETLLAHLPAQTSLPVSTDRRSDHLLGFALPTNAPALRVGTHPFGLDLERLVAGFALDHGFNGRIRPILSPVLAPFYGPCTVPTGALRYGSQGGAWSNGQPPMGGPLQTAFDRALAGVMAAHDVRPGDLAVAPHGSFQGHLLLAVDVSAMTVHQRLAAVALWRRHSA